MLSGVAMKIPSLSQLVRLPKPDLLEHAVKLNLHVPDGSLDLEVRALIARKLHGGSSVLAGLEKEQIW